MELSIVIGKGLEKIVNFFILLMVFLIWMWCWVIVWVFIILDFLNCVFDFKNGGIFNFNFSLLSLDFMLKFLLVMIVLLGKIFFKDIFWVSKFNKLYL